MNGLLLSTTAFHGLSSAAKQEVLAAIGLDGMAPAAVVSAPAAAAAPVVSKGGDGPVELTVAMVRKLTDKLGDKTLHALKIIARSSAPQFHMKDVIEGTAGAKDYMDVRSIWSALTRRTRTVVDDGAVDLIWWTGDEIHDAAGNYVDHVGEVSALTHQSLRTHFNL